jgi:hypothetical protein
MSRSSESFRRLAWTAPRFEPIAFAIVRTLG